MNDKTKSVVWFEDCNRDDVSLVGGKNASLGEMVSSLAAAGINVPAGFATTAEAYREFLRNDNLDDRINGLLDQLDPDNLEQLAACGKQIRGWLMSASLPDTVQSDIIAAWEMMSANQDDGFSVAVRSSATAEDLPDASFAGQQETILNVCNLEQLLESVIHVYASL